MWVYIALVLAVVITLLLCMAFHIWVYILLVLTLIIIAFLLCMAFLLADKNLERLKDGLQIVALVIAGIATGTWTYLTYVKPELLRPDDYIPDVLVQPTFDLIQALPDMAHVSLNMRVVNQSEILIRNLGAWYQVRGMRTGIEQVGSNSLLDDAVSQLNDGNGQELIDRHRVPRESVGTVAVGRILPNIWWFSPGDEQTTQVVLTIPCSMNLLEVTVRVFYFASDEDIFGIEWKNRDGVLWADPTIKEEKDNEVQFRKFDYKSDDDEKLRKRHKLATVKASHEFVIPIVQDQARCQEKWRRPPLKFIHI